MLIVKRPRCHKAHAYLKDSLETNFGGHSASVKNVRFGLIVVNVKLDAAATFHEVIDVAIDRGRARQLVASAICVVRRGDPVVT